MSATTNYLRRLADQHCTMRNVHHINVNPDDKATHWNEGQSTWNQKQADMLFMIADKIDSRDTFIEAATRLSNVSRSHTHANSNQTPA